MLEPLLERLQAEGGEMEMKRERRIQGWYQSQTYAIEKFSDGGYVTGFMPVLPSLAVLCAVVL